MPDHRPITLMPDPIYLGDSVYAKWDGYQLWVYTSDGCTTGTEVALEAPVMQCLVWLAKKVYGPSVAE